MQISILSLKHSPDELYQHLSAAEDIKQAEIFIQPVKQKSPLRTIEPSIVQAILTLSGVAVGALLKGVFDLAKERILIEIKRGDSSTKIEIPKNFNEERVEEILKLLNGVTSSQIVIPKE